MLGELNIKYLDIKKSATIYINMSPSFYLLISKVKDLCF